jgi:hypothetical protein
VPQNGSGNLMVPLSNDPFRPDLFRSLGVKIAGPSNLGSPHDLFKIVR